MRHLAPHVILRKSVVAGREHPHLARDIGQLPRAQPVSRLALSLPGVRCCARIWRCSATMHALADITETLVFTDPYFAAPLNRHTPGLEPWIAPLRADRDLKIAAQEMKHAFVSRTETLVHGDLHSGSMMVTANDTQVIDPEFAIYGPFGFDIGHAVSPICCWPSSRNRATRRLRAARDRYRAHGPGLDRRTCGRSSPPSSASLWQTERTGILYQRSLFEDAGRRVGRRAALTLVLRGIWTDALGFCGVEMHRRILGLAHVEDLEAIADPARRLVCEARALEAGRIIATSRQSLGPADLAGLACDIDRTVAR